MLRLTNSSFAKATEDKSLGYPPCFEEAGDRNSRSFDLDSKSWRGNIFVIIPAKVFSVKITFWKRVYILKQGFRCARGLFEKVGAL